MLFGCWTYKWIHNLYKRTLLQGQIPLVCGLRFGSFELGVFAILFLGTSHATWVEPNTTKQGLSLGDGHVITNSPEQKTYHKKVTFRKRETRTTLNQTLLITWLPLHKSYLIVHLTFNGTIGFKMNIMICNRRLGTSIWLIIDDHKLPRMI